MSAKAVSFETGHEEMIHDAQLDYYGKRLATCSSDRSIRIFDVSASGQHTLTSQIRGHDGPVWQISWAHPKFGAIIASVSYDSRVCVWKETQANNWTKIYEYSRPDSSMNTLSWAPHSFGLVLAVGAADGTVSVLARKPDNTWDVQCFLAHKGGVNSVSWGPDVKSGSLLSQTSAGGVVKYDRRLLSGGCDNHLRLWRLNDETLQWEQQRAFSESGEPAHADWVRDAQFAPSLGLPTNTIASASEDKTVIIWVEDAATGQWRKSKTLRFDTKIYKVSWSLMGNILALAQGDNKVSLWKESLDGDWKQLSQAQAQAYTQAPSPVAPNDPYMQQQQQLQQQQQQPQPQLQQQQPQQPNSYPPMQSPNMPPQMSPNQPQQQQYPQMGMHMQQQPQQQQQQQQQQQYQPYPQMQQYGGSAF